jgi:hypothetical protein
MGDAGPRIAPLILQIVKKSCLDVIIPGVFMVPIELIIMDG